MTTDCTPQTHAPAPPSKGPCPTCDRPRCNGTTKPNTPEASRCRKQPVKGATVCRTHGGSAGQVKAAAEQRELASKADAEVRKLWVGLDAAPEVKDPVSSLARLAGALEQAVDVVGSKVNDLGSVASGSSMQQLRGEVVLLERLLGQLRQALDAMARLGIAEKQVELEQARAEIVVQAFSAGLAVVSLVPADKDAMLRAFLGALGRGPEVLELPGGAS